MARAWPADSWHGPLLVVRLSSLGDVILTTGVLRMLKERRPDLEIHVLTRRAHAEPLRGSRVIDRLILEEEAVGTVASSQPGPDGAPRYALVLDWQGGWKGRRAAARFAPGARVITVSRAALRRRLLVLLGDRIPAPPPYVARLARTVCGFAPDRESLHEWKPEVIPDRERIEALRARLLAFASDRTGSDRERDGSSLAMTQARAMGQALPSRRRLVFAHSAAYPGKAVPARLSEALQAAFRTEGWDVIELIPPSPDSSSESSGEHLSRDVDATGAPRLRFSGSLTDVAALLSLADLFVGSDSGILHLASAVGIPALGLFGPTAPCLGFSPLGRAAAFGVDLPCRPCHIHGVSRCWLGHARCWKEMDPAGVLAAAASLLRQAPAAECAHARASVERSAREDG